MHAEPLERRLDLLEHRRAPGRRARPRGRRCTRPGSRPRAGLPAPRPLDRSAEEVHLAAGVVPVVLARHVVPGELEQPRDGVAVGRVPRGGNSERAGRVRGDHLHLDRARALRPAAAVAASISASELAEERVRDPQVQEARAGDLCALDRRAARRTRAARPARPRAATGRRAPSGARRSSSSRRGQGPSAARARPRGPRARRGPPARRSRARSHAGPEREQVLELLQLVLRPDRDQHVPGLDRHVRARASRRTCRRACAAR